MTTGSQRQRTELSWRRTVLSALVVTALLIRFVLVSAPPVFVVPGALLWVTLVVLARRRIRAIDRPIGRVLPAVGLLVAGYAVTSTALMVHIA